MNQPAPTAQELLARIAALRSQLQAVQRAPAPPPVATRFPNQSRVFSAAPPPPPPAPVSATAVQPQLAYSQKRRRPKAVREATKRKSGYFQQARSLVRLGDSNYRSSVTPNGNRTLTAAAAPPENASLYVSRPHSLRLAVPASSVPPPSAATLVARARALVVQAKQLARARPAVKRKTGSVVAAVERHSNIIRDFRQPCIFFVRFGECKLGAKCRYAHPRDKVAVCRAFLRGTCAMGAERCKLSHAVEPSKMPTCRHFLKGRCAKGSDCEYRHVRVADDAPVCDEFLKGWCPLGLECAKHHTYECLDFMRHGKCERGAACRLLHIADDDAAAAADTEAAPADSNDSRPRKRKRTTAPPAPKRTVDIVDSSSTAPILIALNSSFDDNNSSNNNNNDEDDVPRSISAFHAAAAQKNL